MSKSKRKTGDKSTAEKLRRAEQLVEDKRFDTARPLLNKLLEANPDNVEARYLLAVCGQLTGDLDLAEANFRDVIRRKPQHHQALHGLGLVLEARGRIPDAIDLWKKAVQVKPKFDYAARKLALYRDRVSTDQSRGRTPASKHIVPGLTKKLPRMKTLQGIEISKGLKYTDQHVWIRIDNGVGTVGISDFFRFTHNPTYVWVDELPKVGAMVEFGQIICKITGLVNPEFRKRTFPKGEDLKNFVEERKTFKDARGYFRDPRKRIWISVPSPVSGQVVKINKPLIRKGREFRIIRSREELNLNFPYGKYSWLFRIQPNNKGWEDLKALMDDTAYGQFVGSILTSG